MSTVETDVVLIVDDNPMNLAVLSDMLLKAGIEVAVATNGESALRRLDHQIPALVLLDIMMSGLDGFETCRRITTNPATVNIPIIFMSAIADSEAKIKGLGLGAVDYITKPFQQEEVLARVRTHLKLRSLTKILELQNHQLQRLADGLEQTVRDRTAELSQSLDDLKHIQLQLVQSEKMSSLGNLVAGVAHEINNPVGFLNGSINNAKDYIQDLLDHLAAYQKYYPNAVPSIQDHAEAIDLEFLTEDLPKLVTSMTLATDRIKSISQSLCTFSRADSDTQQKFNVHDGIDSTLMILRHRLRANEHRPEIEVIQSYGQLPEVDCFPGQLNQVFMDVLANAIDALEDASQGRSFSEIDANPNRITIETVIDKNWVKIAIADNGKGMSDEVKAHVFDHLYTTKLAGKGTGLGLTIARHIVVEKHGGAIAVHSALGRGTEFVITLPLLPLVPVDETVGCKAPV